METVMIPNFLSIDFSTCGSMCLWWTQTTTTGDSLDLMHHLQRAGDMMLK